MVFSVGNGTEREKERSLQRGLRDPGNSWETDKLRYLKSVHSSIPAQVEKVELKFWHSRSRIHSDLIHSCCLFT